MRFSVLAFLWLFISAQSYAGKISGGGKPGGGVERDGQVMTFYSAGIMVKGVDEDETDVPGLEDLMSTLYRMPYFTNSRQVAFLSALRPTANRHYRRVIPEFFDQATQDRLIEEYKRVMKIDATTQVVLFAVTDWNSNTTYLLPNFYELKKTSEQQAILFHEARWIAQPDSTYHDVVESEERMQAYLESPSDRNKIFEMVRSAGKGSDLLNASLVLDQEEGGALRSAIHDGKMPLPQLLGEKTMGCLKQRYEFQYCQSVFQYELLGRVMGPRKSFFYSAVLDVIESGRGKLRLYTHSGELGFDFTYDAIKATTIVMRLIEKEYADGQVVRLEGYSTCKWSQAFNGQERAKCPIYFDFY